MSANDERGKACLLKKQWNFTTYSVSESVTQQVHMKCVQCIGTELGAWNGAVIKANTDPALKEAAILGRKTEHTLTDIIQNLTLIRK